MYVTSPELPSSFRQLDGPHRTLIESFRDSITLRMPEKKVKTPYHHEQPAVAERVLGSW